MRYALDTAASRKPRHRGVDDCAVASLAARVAFNIRQVCSWNCLKWVSRLGPRFDLREAGRDKYSTTDLQLWLQRGLLFS